VNQNLLWIVVGILTGVGTGVLGAVVSVRRSSTGYERAVSPATAAVTLGLAVAAWLTALKVEAAWPHRMWLLLVPTSLVYWFMSQVRTILRARGRGRGDRGREV